MPPRRGRARARRRARRADVMDRGAAGGREVGDNGGAPDSDVARRPGGRDGGGQRSARGGARRSGDRVGGSGGVGASSAEAFTLEGTGAPSRGSSGVVHTSRSGILPPMLEMVDVAAHPPERFESVLEPEPFEKLADGIRTARELLGERTVWNVSSTAKGGGVVELLLPLIGYAQGRRRRRALGGDRGQPRVLQGHQADPQPPARLRGRRRRPRRRGAQGLRATRSSANARELVGRWSATTTSCCCTTRRPAGLIGPLKRTGARVIWRCHIGIDEPNDIARARVGLPARRRRAGRRLRVLARGVRVGGPRRRQGRRSSRRRSTPSTPRTRSSSPRRSHAILAAAGIVDGGDGEPTFKRGDGSEARVAQPGRDATRTRA